MGLFSYLSSAFRPSGTKLQGDRESDTRDNRTTLQHQDKYAHKKMNRRAVLGTGAAAIATAMLLQEGRPVYAERASEVLRPTGTSIVREYNDVRISGEARRQIFYGVKENGTRIDPLLDALGEEGVVRLESVMKRIEEEGYIPVINIVDGHLPPENAHEWIRDRWNVYSKRGYLDMNRLVDATRTNEKGGSTSKSVNEIEKYLKPRVFSVWFSSVVKTTIDPDEDGLKPNETILIEGGFETAEILDRTSLSYQEIPIRFHLRQRVYDGMTKGPNLKYAHEVFEKFYELARESKKPDGSSVVYNGSRKVNPAPTVSSKLAEPPDIQRQQSIPPAVKAEDKGQLAYTSQLTNKQRSEKPKSGNELLKTSISTVLSAFAAHKIARKLFPNSPLAVPPHDALLSYLQKLSSKKNERYATTTNYQGNRPDWISFLPFAWSYVYPEPDAVLDQGKLEATVDAVARRHSLPPPKWTPPSLDELKKNMHATERNLRGFIDRISHRQPHTLPSFNIPLGSLTLRTNENVGRRKTERVTVQPTKWLPSPIPQFSNKTSHILSKLISNVQSGSKFDSNISLAGAYAPIMEAKQRLDQSQMHDKASIQFWQNLLRKEANRLYSSLDSRKRRMDKKPEIIPEGYAEMWMKNINRGKTYISQARKAIRTKNFNEAVELLGEVDLLRQQMSDQSYEYQQRISLAEIAELDRYQERMRQAYLQRVEEHKLRQSELMQQVDNVIAHMESLSPYIRANRFAHDARQYYNVLNQIRPHITTLELGSNELSQELSEATKSVRGAEVFVRRVDRERENIEGGKRKRKEEIDTILQRLFEVGRTDGLYARIQPLLETVGEVDEVLSDGVYSTDVLGLTNKVIRSLETDADHLEEEARAQKDKNGVVAYFNNPGRPVQMLASYFAELQNRVNERRCSSRVKLDELETLVNLSANASTSLEGVYKNMSAFVSSGEQDRREWKERIDDAISRLQHPTILADKLVETFGHGVMVRKDEGASRPLIMELFERSIKDIRDIEKDMKNAVASQPANRFSKNGNFPSLQTTLVEPALVAQH